MMAFLNQIPYMEPYENPIYFVYLLIALIPVIIGLFFKKRFPIYELVVTIGFLLTMFGQGHSNQLIAFLLFLVWQTVCVFFYQWYRQKWNHTSVFISTILFALMPLISVKLSPLSTAHSSLSLFSFLGISYLSFKSLAMIIEMRDGVLKSFTVFEFSRFLMFLPTFSSGPIDHFRRFQEDYNNLPDRDAYLELIDKAIMSIMLGFLYKFIISFYLGSVWLPVVESEALARGGSFQSLCGWSYVPVWLESFF